MNNSEDQISLILSRNEAIVLFEFLSRFTDTRSLSLEDQAEQRVLWDMCAMLEKSLPEPLFGSYDETLASARDLVRDKE